MMSISETSWMCWKDYFDKMYFVCLSMLTFNQFEKEVYSRLRWMIFEQEGRV